MRKPGLILAAALISVGSLSVSVFAKTQGRNYDSTYLNRDYDGGPYHQHRLSDGTLTGPLPSDNPNG